MAVSVRRELLEARSKGFSLWRHDRGSVVLDVHSAIRANENWSVHGAVQTFLYRRVFCLFEGEIYTPVVEP